jgi:uncharacterized cupredoxin-like copper-binding protein
VKRLLELGLLTAVAAIGVARVSAPSTLPVEAVVKEWKVSLSTATHVAGPITFHLDNQGNIDHEFVILQTDALAKDLVPLVDPTTYRLDEEAFVSPGEYGDLPAGTTGTFTITLPPGHYVMMCNIAGHYAPGMYADLVVVAP